MQTVSFIPPLGATRPRPRAAARLAVALVASVALYACSDRGPDASAGVAPSADSARAQFPPGKYGELAYQGYLIFTQTPKAARIYTGNGLSCANCHLDNGRRPDSAPMWGAFGMYPAYQAKFDRVVTLEERIQQCFQFSENGISPPLDSNEIRAIVTYIQWVSRDRPVGVALPGRGFPTVPDTGSDPDPLHGKVLFGERCAACHGAHGEGRKNSAGDYAFPPLWGFQSFNKGAGMHRIDLLAGFLKANMPYGNPNLTDQDAWDIAAWVELQERWPDPRKGLLFGFLER
ncbi:cytochrome C [Burkholderia sp. Bp8963]|uniref:c-type cytochrome n=1 Tax=Burkholderia sp. Bp8963 TaxID=2184547 RepID=UPI000F5A8E15|nr:c-type cytochrome [Burkholderia sp. Bp8963]RQS64114.1 cytochrome C [Burkholderia sp. Bp8963]